MKIKILGSYLLTFFAVSAFAQKVENDDMYFNAKDRAALNASNQVAALTIAKNSKREEVKEDEFVNPTDSYSARNINPEYSARSNAQEAQADNQDYFINNYQYQTATNLNRFNNNWNNWYGSSWYNSNYWSPSIYGWNSPYYGNYYSAYGNPWNNPYYQSAWSSSFSYYWGNSWDYGWGGYNSWNYCPNYYGGYGSYYGYNPGYYGGGFGFGYGGYYPRTIVVVNNNNGYSEGGRTVVYGKRPSRSSSEISNNYNTRTRTSYTTDSGSGRNNSGGRTATRDEYYNKSWRYTAPSNSGTTNNSRTYSSGFGNESRSSGNSNSNSSYSPSRSSNSGGNNSSYSGGSNSRSSTPAPSGGSNGRTRGSR